MGACVTRYRSLEFNSPALEATLQPSSVAFFAFTLPVDIQQRRQQQDVVVRCRVLSGRIRGIYCARDQSFPSQTRKLWETQRYCSCPVDGCDHCFPYCLNDSGGICATCMTHSDDFARISHDPQKGGHVNDQLRSSSSGGGGSKAEANEAEEAMGGIDVAAASGGDNSSNAERIVDPPYAHQTDYEFALRLSPTIDPSLLSHPGDRFFVTVEAAEEKVSRALRKQRKLEGEEPYHSTTFVIWIESAVPKAADPRAGNEARVNQAAERAQRMQQESVKQQVLREKVQAEDAARRRRHEEQRVINELAPDLQAHRATVAAGFEIER